MGKYARTEGMGSGILHQVCQVSKIHEVGLELLWRNLPFLSRIRDNWSKIREELPFIRSVALSCQVRIPKEIDADGNDVTPDKETFLKQGSRKCPKPTEGDELTDQIQRVGLVSNHVLTAEEFARYKRDHWRIENCLHYVLDEDFLEDKSTARKSKNVLSVIRKTAYNIIRLMQIDAPKDRKLVIDVIDEITDDFSIVLKWIFDPIPSFY